MLTIYCHQCRAPQRRGERDCVECGHRFGGNVAWLLLGLAVAVGGPLFLLFSASTAAITERHVLQTLFYYVLPVLVGTLAIYDHDGRRVMAYLYGGGALIIAGVVWLNN